MSSKPTHLAIAGVTLITAILTGCASTPTEPPATTREAAFRTALCNLGASWDRETQTSRADYSAPTLDPSVTADYGPTIANDRCSDAQIWKWQELRRAANEDDTICRVVWFDDHIASVTYDIGCAVPVAVTHASR